MKWATWTLILLAACAGTETGNPGIGGTLGYDAYSSRPAEVAVRANASIRVDAAWLSLGDVTFAAAEACDETAAHVAGLGVGDHAATQAPPSPVALGEGRYCAVRLRLERARTAEAGARPELAERSILLRGTLAGGAGFELASAYEGELTLRAPGAGFELDEMHSGVVVGFDLATWLGALPWTEVAANEGGVIRVDNANYPNLLQAFESRLAAGVALFRDEDGDGELDPNAQPIARAAD